MQLTLTEKTKLDFEKNAQSDVEEKKNNFREHRTHAYPPPKAHARRLNWRRVCVSANVQQNKIEASYQAETSAFFSARKRVCFSQLSTAPPR